MFLYIAEPMYNYNFSDCCRRNFSFLGTHIDTHKEEPIELQNCDAYEITKPRPQSQHRSLAMDDNPAYSVYQH